tara:strand:- start:51 stop:1172 length:1122 start_codon:yes stop_codon:yes gene_type:complete
MNKLIFRKFSLDILSFFLVSSFSITFIIWIIQAVNLLDLVSDDGHGLGVYFYYASLSLPKIFSKTIIFIFFISIFYIINKYKNSNEMIVFWNNGIKKIQFINFILKFSIFFLLLQLILNLFIVPSSQNLARKHIKDSKIEFLPNLISEKKFINVVKNLTIFVEEYKKEGELKKIYINESLEGNKSKIIVAKNGLMIKKDNNFILRLFDGGITNINPENTYKLNFSETDYDLSNFSTKTITYQKIQELNSFTLINCIKEYYLKKIFISNDCKTRTLKSFLEEIYKRLILPFYTLVISLIGASLIIEPKSKYFNKYHGLYIFLIGTIIIIISQLSLKFILTNNIAIYFLIFLPLVLVSFYYLFLSIKTKFNLGLL